MAASSSAAITTSYLPTAVFTRGSIASSSWPPPKQRLRLSSEAENPRTTLRELSTQIEGYFGRRLVSLYLFGSLAAGDFYPGRSDLDLLALLDLPVVDSEIEALHDLHERFEATHPEWRGRIEVLYISRDVLRTFAADPQGLVARISPGEPLHQRDLEGNLGWLLDWHDVMDGGETIIGQPPATLGLEVTQQRLREAVLRQLADLRALVRRSDVGYVPAQQGYIVATVCRSLYLIATGRRTSKEKAVAWYADNHPEQADFVWSSYRLYRADVRGPHERLIRFVDIAASSVD